MNRFWKSDDQLKSGETPSAMLFSVRKQYFFTHNQILEIQKENRRLKKLSVTDSQTVDDVDKNTSNESSIVFAKIYYK